LRFPHIFHALPASRPKPAWPLIYAFWLLKNDVLIFVGSNQTCLASGQSAGHRRWQPAKEPCHENPLSPPAHPLLAGLLSALPLAALAASPT
jgi:hypothetical protein